MTLEERLNEQINELQREKENLEQQIEDVKNQNDLTRNAWQMHQVFDNDEFSQQKPFPRLEMRLQRVSENDWYEIEWHYGLVYKHYADVTGNKLRFIPLGHTSSCGGNGTFGSRLYNGKLNLPFRDGFHIQADSAVFGLPAYIVCREKNICQQIDVGDINISGMTSN